MQIRASLDSTFILQSATSAAVGGAAAATVPGIASASAPCWADPNVSADVTEGSKLRRPVLDPHAWTRRWKKALPWRKQENSELSS